MIERRTRPTIMDGEAVMFATSFSERDSAFGPHFDATGPFEVTASRNAVIVHRAELQSDSDYHDFLEALQQAKHAAVAMSQERHGGKFNGRLHRTQISKTPLTNIGD